MITRRQTMVLAGSGLIAATARADGAGAGETAASLAQSLEDSDLIYISPMRSDGSLSACQAEIWFQSMEGSMYVVTGADAWRARAPQLGLTAARVWVGDVGEWDKSDGAYLRLPSIETQCSVVSDQAEHARVLDRMGSKYRMAWVVWGPRFRNGLADGSRVMLKYTPDTTG